MPLHQIRAGNQNEGGQPQLPDREVGVLQRREPDPNCEVQAFLDDVHAAVGRIDQNLHLGVVMGVSRNVGREALYKFAGDLRATHPHFVYTPHGEPQALHNAGRLAWGSGPRGEAPDYTGLDVIITRNGKISALYVFLDSMPS